MINGIDTGQKNDSITSKKQPLDLELSFLFQHDLLPSLYKIS